MEKQLSDPLLFNRYTLSLGSVDLSSTNFAQSKRVLSKA